MRIGIYTNMDERCGNAQDGRNLGKALAPYCAVALSSNPSVFMEYGWDAVILNWHPARVRVDVPLVKQLQSVGVKVILLFQNSFDWPHHVGKDDILFACDAVVAHEPMRCNAPIAYIPHGILEIDGLGTPDFDNPTIGTAGFAFPWKRPDVVVKAALATGVGANMICPEYPGVVDPSALEHLWRSWISDRLSVVKAFLPEEQVIQQLALSTVNIFWYQSRDIHDQYGQSGSVRLGIAAKRPMIVSQHRKFWTMLEEYGEEFYVAETEEDVFALAESIINRCRRGNDDTVYKPDKIVKAQGWSQIGKRYAELIQSLCEKAASA